MKKKKIEVITGALLHDIGKCLFRDKDTQRTHSQSGEQWVREAGIDNREILRQIKYHHSNEIRNSANTIPDDSLSYITYWADNVASGADRRDKDEEYEGSRYVRDVAMESVFNILNGNREKRIYSTAIISEDGEINYPISQKKEIDSSIYAKITDNIKDSLRGMDLEGNSLNSLLEILEANLTYIPSSTDTKQICDISLFDHVKLTAAFASSILDYLEEKGIDDYKEMLYKNGKSYYDEEAFLLCSMDISGIQNFIYTIATSRALKNLRARSFYLEMMMEHIADQYLNKLDLSRANLLYTGGGHAYFILPNTRVCRDITEAYGRELNNWLMDNFGVDLYVAIGYTPCSANMFMNKPAGSYREMFSRVSLELSKSKAVRYTAEDIRKLNSITDSQNERECAVCGKSSNLVSDDRCEICDSLEHLAIDLMEKDFIVILSQKPEEKSLVLPEEFYMVMKNRDEVTAIIKDNQSYVRCYGKNKRFAGNNLATKLWVGDYSSHKEFNQLADNSTGIPRLGVLRADVDNLGRAFIAGFEDQYTSISRTTTFSRMLSEYFKHHINYLLKNPSFSMSGEEKSSRKALIVYSGGDDIFLIGAWDDVIEFAVDLNNSLQNYAQGTLTISAGIGMFSAKYPVSAMAYETGLLEDYSKSIEGKNTITIFDNTGAYSWNDFEELVIGEKFKLINRYFTINKSEKGNSFLYRMLDYIRNLEDDKINLARYAYMLARVKPKETKDPSKEEIYNEFSQKMYSWIRNKKDRKELITAIYLYVYLNRGKEGDHGETK